MASILRSTLLLILCGSMLIGDPAGLLAGPINNGMAISESLVVALGNGLNAGNRKKKKKASRTQRTERSYTRRGNPGVTRRVATDLLIERLPELAALINLDADLEESVDSTDVLEAVEDSEDATALVPTAGAMEATAGDSYEDRELSDEEDPDRLNAEDEEYLEMSDDEMTIDAFYKDFTDYMRGLHGELHITDNGIDMIVAMESLMDWLGTRYLFGGTSKSGIDCSAFTRTMYRECGVQLPRTAAMQWDAGGDPVDRDGLQFGDLIFFHTRKSVYVSHVGIYLGNDMFCHASSRNGVTVSSLESNYYSTHFIGARRFDFTDTEETEDSRTAEATLPATTDSIDVATSPALARAEG